jgi:hypothetical protein
MKVKASDLEWFIKNIRRRAEVNGKTEITDAELATELARYIERNPRCIDIHGVSDPGRYSYSTVGYGVFSLFGERYRMGRIEIHDREDDSGYAVSEGSYSMPFVAANQFEDFIESLETDLPIHIEIGSHKWCEAEVSKDLGIPVEKLNDPETKKAYYRQKYIDEYGYTPEEGERLLLERLKARSEKKDENC